MTNATNMALLFLGAHLAGTIPFGLLVARLKGVDIRSVGSGNVGATNVGRVLGRKWGVLVLLLDAGKGAAATIAARLVMDHAGMVGVTQRDLVWLGAGFACVLGNIAPFYLGFRGGKGVAASLGAIMGIYPYMTLPGLAVLFVFAVTALVSRYVSLASIVAACSLPLIFSAACLLAGWPLVEHWPLFSLGVLLATFITIRHRANLARIRAGTENRIGSRTDR
ncbi:MAG: glycerol-3-phosphate acyltransferase [Phycisphaerae bacterium]|nr:MAG: glycerol-3-phosphate 1-O-acyltransferase PlsY [Planctomycetia bacterium]GJQ26322.1 MAG: glycerol-3-phosphate acyltransferase [Phycisphaerae bacterium]